MQELSHGLLIYSCFCYFEIVRVELATHEAETFFYCRFACAAAAHVWVQNDAASGCYESAKVLHERGGFDCCMIITAL